MSITFNEDANLVTKITPDKELYAVFEGVDYEVIVGDSAKIEVGQAINYIKSGKAEIQEGVDEVLNAFNANATEKINAFNTNAENKTTDFNNNYQDKKGLIDAQVAVASGYADEAKQWAIGEPTEPDGYSSKYWANQSASAAATVGDGTITLTQGGVTKGSFTVNQSGNTTIALDAGGGATMTYTALTETLTWS